MSEIQPEHRALGAMVGGAIGDALAMPVHWYYNRLALHRDYGLVDGFLKPRNPHPDSILWRTRYEAVNEKGEIFHDQAEWLGQPGIHYHQFLEAGENTVTWQLAMETWNLVNFDDGYQHETFLERYVRFMTTPGNHRDTYLEECHRGFFTNYASGNLPPGNCAVTEKHIGGLAGVIPVVVWYQDDRQAAVEMAKKRVSATHAGAKMGVAVELLADLLWQVLNGRPLAEAILEVQQHQANVYARHPFAKWAKLRDEQVIGPMVSPACYLEDSVPATLFLALKYHDNPRQGLIANTMLGGDNVHRGIVLGALLGAENGLEAWPPNWRSELKRSPERCPVGSRASL